MPVKWDWFPWVWHESGITRWWIRHYNSLLRIMWCKQIHSDSHLRFVMSPVSSKIDYVYQNASFKEILICVACERCYYFYIFLWLCSLKWVLRCCLYDQRCLAQMLLCASGGKGWLFLSFGGWLWAPVGRFGLTKEIAAPTLSTSNGCLNMEGGKYTVV